MSTTTSAPATTSPKSPAPSPDASSEAATHESRTRGRTVDGTWTQRAADTVTRFLDRSGLTRRGFLTKTAIVGSALAVDPTGLLLKPQTAWASVCGDANECHQGWSAFCATINNGANECPDGSFTAGWWKIDNSDFCSGAARYIVDCNEIPPQGSKCSCRCANGECDRRRVCCNDFRYGQCNTQVAGTTPVVCRVVLCTPPWQWDDDCTSTTLTDNQTRTHWSAALPSRTNPTPITVRWLEMGLVGSVLGDMVGDERNGPDGGDWAEFDGGVMTWQSNRGTAVVVNPHAERYAFRNGPRGPLGYPVRDVFGRPEQVTYQDGHTYRGPEGIKAVWGPVDDLYQGQGGHDGWLGAPLSDVVSRDDTWRFARMSRYSVVHSIPRNETRILRRTVDLPANGSWPATTSTARWHGEDRFATAVEVSTRAHADGADTVLIATGQDFADATAAGAITARLDASILLTAQDTLPAVVEDEIRRLGATRAILLGGLQAISARVANHVARLVETVERWAGPTRNATSAEISRRAFPNGSTHVMVTTGAAFPDALTVAPLAHQRNAPLLLTKTDELPTTVRDEIRRLGATTCTVVGGTRAVSSRVARQLSSMGLDVGRIAGNDRYDTARRIADDLGGNAVAVMVVTGTNYPDGLAASTWAAKRRIPILLVNDGVPSATDRALLSRRPRRSIIVGGPSAVPWNVRTALNSYPR